MLVGVELEFVLPRTAASRDVAERAVEAALRSAGLDARLEAYNHETRAHAKLVRDASVSDGLELVLPPLEAPEAIEVAEKAADALRAAGCTTDRRCGLHVHVDARALTAAEIAVVVRRYARDEARIDEWMPESRRASYNNYCKSIALFLNEQRLQMLTSLSKQNIHTVFWDRYYKINLCSLPRHGTIEFRQHNGTLKAPRIRNWIRFVTAYVAESQRVAALLNGEPPRQVFRDGSKRATVFELLCRDTGAAIFELQAATGWQHHTIRALLTCFRHDGYRISATGHGQNRVYRIVAAPGAQAAEPSAPNGALPETDHVMAGIPADVARYYREQAAYFRRRLSLSGAI